MLPGKGWKRWMEAAPGGGDHGALEEGVGRGEESFGLAGCFLVSNCFVLSFFSSPSPAF